MKNNGISKLKIIILALVIALTAFTFISCSEDDDNKFEHTITHASADYDTAAKYVFEQGQTATVSFFVKFDSEMPDSVADEGIYVDLRAGDTILSKFNVAHTAADMDAGITIDVPIPTDTLGTTDYHIILLSKYGAGCGGSSSHATRLDFVVEIIEPATDSSGTGGTDGDDSDNSGTDGDDSDTDSTDGTGGTDDTDGDNSGTDGTDSGTGGTGGDNSSDGTGGSGGTGSGGTESSYSFTITTQPTAFTSISPVANNILTCTAQSSATASANLQYQWYTSLLNSYDNATEMTGKTSSTISLSSESYSKQYYFCEVTDPSTNRVIRSNIVLGVFIIPNAGPEELYINIISQTGEKVQIPVGEDSFNINVVAQSNGSLTYQWYGRALNGEFEKIDGATSNTYDSLSLVATNTTYYFQCVITSTLNGKTISVTSETIQVFGPGVPIG